MPTTIQIPVRLDSAAFQEFALFDTMRLRQRWRNPVIFAVLMLTFSVTCFALNNGGNGAPLVGCVLLAVGLGLPLVYFFQFFRSVKRQAKAMGLENTRHVYTVRLGDDGVQCSPADASAQVTLTPWADVYGAWRTAGSIYLYVSMQRAYLLPDGQANVPTEELWQALNARLGPQRCHSVR